jgi:ATP-dependent DNA helicase DinG
MIAQKRITDAVIAEMQKAIAEADGVEVLFCAKQNAQGLIATIKTVARGTSSAVPALFPHMLEGDIVLHNHPSGVLLPSQADMHIASLLGNQGIGFYIVDNQVVRVQCVVEPVARHQEKALDVQPLVQLISTGGRLSQLNPLFKPRQSQQELLAFVAQALNDKFIAVAEGGTGVGKSYAYLIPAFAWAKANQERIVISTATIALQEQLIQKDIPMVKKLLNSQIKALLVKGRQNYLCLHRMQEAITEDGMFMQEGDDLSMIQQWSQTTKIGDRVDLPRLPAPEIWSRVNGEADTCLGIKCPHYNQCFIFKARREAADAHILVANHHLLFADLALRRQLDNGSIAILPPFKKVIFDEAHHIENSAVSFFSENISMLSVQRQMGRLLRRKSGRELGLLPQLVALLPDIQYSQLFDQAYALVQKVREQAEALQQKSELYIDDTVRLAGEASLEISMGVLQPIANLHQVLGQLAQTLSQVYDAMSENAQQDTSGYELKSVLRRINDMAVLCASFLQYNDKPDHVFWLEKRKVQHDKSYFQFFLKKVGLYGVAHLQPRLKTAIFPSPFDYPQRVVLSIPNNAPLPEHELDFAQFTHQSVAHMVQQLKGRVLVLFTSYRALQDCANALHKTLPDEVLLLQQGQAERGKLIQQFVSHGHAVLLGTDTFWEGVDIDNRALKAVIITKLPFQPPHAPIAAARQERVERRGGNAFMELQVPEASLKLKQGFGRLMRKADDFGTVMILDARILKKRYGQTLLQALPPAKTCFAPLNEVLMSSITFIKGIEQQ